MKNKVTRADSRSDVLDNLVKHLEAQRAKQEDNSTCTFTPATYAQNNTSSWRGDFTPCIFTGGIVLSHTDTKPKEALNEAF